MLVVMWWMRERNTNPEAGTQLDMPRPFCTFTQNSGAEIKTWSWHFLHLRSIWALADLCPHWHWCHHSHSHHLHLQYLLWCVQSTVSGSLIPDLTLLSWPTTALTAPNTSVHQIWKPFNVLHWGSLFSVFTPHPRVWVVAEEKVGYSAWWPTSKRKQSE